MEREAPNPYTVSGNSWWWFDKYGDIYGPYGSYVDAKKGMQKYIEVLKREEKKANNEKS